MRRERETEVTCSEKTHVCVWGGDKMGIPPAGAFGGHWGGGSMPRAHLYWGGERRGGLLLPLLGSGSTGAPTSSWLRGRRLLAEPGFSMPGLLRRGKLLSARAAWRAQGWPCEPAPRSQVRRCPPPPPSEPPGVSVRTPPADLSGQLPASPP